MNIFKSGLLIFLFLNAYNSFSQDLFIYKNGEELNVKVLRINKNDISYKKYSNLNGPEYIEDKANLFMIKYENGTKDIFNTNPTTESIPEKIATQNCEHKEDSVVFINNKYMVVCKNCNEKIRFASIDEVTSNGNNGNGIKLPCGEKPTAPPTYNDPQYKQTSKYKQYQKELNIWLECTGN